MRKIVWCRIGTYRAKDTFSIYVKRYFFPATIANPPMLSSHCSVLSAMINSFKKINMCFEINIFKKFNSTYRKIYPCKTKDGIVTHRIQRHCLRCQFFHSFSSRSRQGFITAKNKGGNSESKIIPGYPVEVVENNQSDEV